MRVSSVCEMGVTYIGLYDSEVSDYLNSVIYRQQLLSIGKKSMDMAHTKQIQVKDVRTGVVLETFKSVPVRIFQKAA